MKIHVFCDRVTPEQVAKMLEDLQTYTKLAVDVERGIVAGGGEWHADCEQAQAWSDEVLAMSGLLEKE